jgi:DNA mismatch repair ATPase MutS
MEQVEHEHFNAVVLLKYQSVLKGESIVGQLPDNNHSASNAIKRLSRIIGALDQRFSFMGMLLNLLYMRDTRQAMKLESWKQVYAARLPVWFEALGVFDMFCSYGAFAFNHPDYNYPVLTDSYFAIEGKALGHPLIHRDKCVCNDILIPKSKFFIIITGANMAGKSTFLRTVGVNYLLTCMGLPVYAESLAVYPAQLVTSLRTADSLVSNESYFFAELKRLKMIIDRLDAGEELFIILDEILKGTNSIDKQKGSRALVEQLIRKNTCGIIATHDLLLGLLAEQFPEHVQNKCFEADIQGDELSFTYQLRDGIAQNMNATFLMEKMGIY